MQLVSISWGTLVANRSNIVLNLENPFRASFPIYFNVFLHSVASLSKNCKNKSQVFIFTLLYGSTSKGFMKAVNIFIKPFEYHKEVWKYNSSWFLFWQFFYLKAYYIITRILNGTLINAKLRHATLTYLALINVACKFS